MRRSTSTIAVFSLASLIALLSVTARGDDTIPLFELFPSLKAQYPRVKIMKGPTPIEPMKKLERELLVDEDKLWVKRDDGSTDPLGGNKARKLEFLLGDARAHGAKTLVTSGMYGSNHAFATAIAAKRFCFKTQLILGPQPVTEDVKLKLLSFHALGAEIRYHSGKIGMGLDMLESNLFSGKDTYNIPPGGSDSIGDLGYVNAYLEMAKQLPADQLPERIVVPVGTMGTAAGLLVGSCLAGTFEKVRIEGVGVADPLLTNDIVLRKQAIRLYLSIREKLSASEKKRLPMCNFMTSDKAFKYIDSYYDPGYGAAKPRVHEAIALLKKTEGLITEPTYSGKAFAYLVDDLQSAVAHDKHIGKTLFWQTYDSYDLNKIVDSYHWKDPKAKWLELPEDFHHLFTDGCTGMTGSQFSVCAEGAEPPAGQPGLKESMSAVSGALESNCPADGESSR